jgi:lipopolysaccharide/colanic/teichoic acid biosynthesis glycosyltransferase
MKMYMQTNYTQQSETRYRYIKVRAGQTEPSPIFLYIGSSIEHFDLIRQELGTGWMVDSMAEVEAALRSLRPDTCRISAVFLDDPAVFGGGFVALKKLRGHVVLKDAAFIANMRGLSAQILLELRRLPVIDELTDFRVESALIPEKLEMIRRVRKSIKERGGSIKPEYSANAIYGQRFLIKRFLDLVTASVLLAATLPIFLLIALAIKIETRGPVFYNSYRAGRGYRIFKFFKFRTMKVGADRMIQSIAHLNKYNNFGYAPVFFKAHNDPRITKVGQFLRNSGLDELPQLINVFIGDMSIVGNRPLPLYEACALTGNDTAERFVSAAGITGLWQINVRNSYTLSCEDRIDMDIQYARHSSLRQDLTILLYTPFFLVRAYLNRKEKNTAGISLSKTNEYLVVN